MRVAAVSFVLLVGFEAALRAALASPSDGVSFWSWPPLADEESKRDIVARRAR